MPKLNSSPIQIRTSDFENVQYLLTFTNTTTRTHLSDSAAVRIVEFTPKGLILTMPTKSCSVGHNLSLRFEFGPNSFVMTAKVLSSESDDRNNATTELEVIQYDKNDWNSFQGLFSERQKYLDSIMKKIKK